MEPTESSNEAERCGRAALTKMAELKILFYPRNYTIWYTYFTGKYPDLSNMLNTFMTKEGYFNEDHNTLIYQKFFGFEQLGRTIREVTAGTSKVLGDAYRHVLKLCSDSETARKELESTCVRLEKADTSAEMKQLVSEILTRVRALEEATKSMEQRLEGDFKKIADLHRNLEESQRENMTDALTGIANRKLFDACVQLSSEDKRKSVSLCMLLIDIDHLGKFNETHSFKAGDMVLLAVSKALNATIKGRDMAARYGDDEFAVLATRSMLTDAVGLARSIRGEVGNSRRAVDADAMGKMRETVTVSIGVAQYVPGEPLSSFLTRLKQALDFAKSNGRNQVVSVEKSSQGVVFCDEKNHVITTVSEEALNRE